MDSETPRLSPSIAQKLMDEGPLSAWANHRLLGNLRKPSTDSQIRGRIFHAAILGTTSEVEVVDAEDFRTKAAREQRERILMEGKTPVVASKWLKIVSVGKIVRSKLEDELGTSFQEAQSEVRLEWDEDGVACSGSIDLVIPDGDSPPTIIELKTDEGFPTESKAIRTLAGSHALYQETAYRRGLAESEYGKGAYPELFDVIYAFVQVNPPFGIYCCRMAGDFRELSALRWDRAKGWWRDLLGTDGWHQSRGVALLSAPGWLLNRELLEEAMSDE